MKTSTYFALLAEFETAQIPLVDMCEKYFAISPSTAKKRAYSQLLDVPVFKAGESGKTPYLVSAEDLAEFIDKQHEKAKKDWQHVNSTSQN